MPKMYIFEDLPEDIRAYIPISKYGEYVRPRTIKQWFDLIKKFSPEIELDETAMLRLFPYLYGDE